VTNDFNFRALFDGTNQPVITVISSDTSL